MRKAGIALSVIAALLLLFVSGCQPEEVTTTVISTKSTTVTQTLPASTITQTLPVLTTVTSTVTFTPATTSASSTATNTTTPVETTETESTQRPYKPMDIFSGKFNPYTDMADIFTVFAASFDKGSPKLEGRNPFVLSMTAEGNMYAAVAYQADMAGLSEEEKNNRFNDYSEYGFCEFTGTDGRVVTISQTQPHDEQHENGACLIELTYDVPAMDMEKYIDLIRDNYNMNALSSVAEYMDIETDFAECSISVDLQKNETTVAVQYYVDDSEALQQSIAAELQSEWGEWYGHPSTNITCGLIRNTLVFDSRFGDAVLILQTSNELNTPLSEYVEPEFSLVKFGFVFDDAWTCGVYEEREPHYKSVAIHRPEWGEHPDGWNIELCDTNVNGYSLLMWYYADEDMYHISLEKDGGASYDYFPATGEHTGHPDEIAQIFNDCFGTQGDDFYDKPLAYFEQFVQERFGMSIQELYALPKQ
jgi:hypothetical protein